MLVCKKDNNLASRVWQDLDETLKEEVQQFFVERAISRERSEDTAVITMKLIECLPGENAKEY